jgi:pyruvate kinase
MSFATHKTPPPVANEDLIRQVESLRQAVERQAELNRVSLLKLPPDRQHSAENLLHYLALRSRDLRTLQDQLTRLGLSSLGRAEPHVLATINAVLHNLCLISGLERPSIGPPDVYAAFDAGADRLEQNTIGLLGPHPKKRRVHIMGTMPTEAANDYLMVHQLLKSGMDCLRINCAHDDPSVWFRMIEHLRFAERVTGQSCRILMDLGGPKLRTGPMEPVPSVLKIRPVRASNGQVIRPARIWLSSGEAARCEMSAADASLNLDPDWLSQMVTGDRIRLRDARGSRRSWFIKEVTSDGCWAEARKTTYVDNETVLNLCSTDSRNDRVTVIGSLPALESVVLLRTGDVLFMSGTEEAGKPAIHGDSGELLNPGTVSVPIPEIYRDARPGERVCFDDGRISGIVEKVDAGQLQIRITHTRKPLEKLASNKGVNFPDTHLGLPALSGKDLQDLEFAARHANMVGLSFANSPDDIRALRKRLLELGCDNVGVVIKIETKRGFSNLPGMLLEALKFPTCGVMIARGDLAVECGFERMAEVQEEILWVCESAHVPVIWATQVLEGLTKRGHASRAEITDAAMSQAAECVMLNKGPHIIEAVTALDDILQRMQSHHSKKRSMLRQLDLASAFQAGKN